MPSVHMWSLFNIFTIPLIKLQNMLLKVILKNLCVQSLVFLINATRLIFSIEGFQYIWSDVVREIKASTPRMIYDILI